MARTSLSSWIVRRTSEGLLMSMATVIAQKAIERTSTALYILCLPTRELVMAASCAGHARISQNGPGHISLMAWWCLRCSADPCPGSLSGGWIRRRTFHHRGGTARSPAAQPVRLLLDGEAEGEDLVVAGGRGAAEGVAGHQPEPAVRRRHDGAQASVLPLHEALGPACFSCAVHRDPPE